MKLKNYFVLLLLSLFTVASALAQEKTISGTVSDESGMPLPGVNIIVKGTTNGTQTDFDGNYTITANAGDVLSFTYVGLKTAEQTVGSSNTINATMQEDAAVLDEVVVTALGIKRDKKSLGYSQQTVDSENLVRSRETDIANALAGKISGVQFKGAPSSGFGNSLVRIRGDVGVLYIVDGVKVDSSSDVATEDIDNISVLKGIAGSALYGPEGKNGVIIITTKRAEAGQSNIVINHSTSMSSVSRLPEYQNEYGGGYSQDFNEFTYNPAIHPASWSSFNNQKMVEYYADESWGPRFEGQMVRHWDSWIAGDSEFGKLREWKANPNNVKNFYDTGIESNTSATFNKAGEDYSVRVSFANISKTGVSPNSDRNTKQLTANLSLDLSEKLTAFANINYQARNTKNFPDNGYGNISSNFNQWWQRQLDTDRLRDYRRNGQIVSWNINGPTNTTPLYWDMPFFETHENLNFQTKNATYGKIGLKYKFNDDLNISIEGRRSVNSLEFNNRSAWGGLEMPSYSEAEVNATVNELFGIANYQRKIGEDFDVSVNAGFELRSFNSKDIIGSTSGGLSVENFYSLNTSVDRPNLSSRVFKARRKSIFTKGSVGYKNIIYLDGSYRLDWESTAYAKENRVSTYGISASIIFSKLLPKNDILTFGKLRVGKALAPGFPGIYDTSATFGVGTPYGTYGTLSTPGALTNPFLKGGERQETEIGTELKFLNNRIGLDVTYFEKIDQNLPVNVTLDGATGYSSTKDNKGKQTYTGIEIGLNLVPIRNDNFEWNLDFNFATLERTVNAIAEGIDVNVIASSWRGIQLQERVGEEWGAIYGRAYQRDDAGNIILSSSGSPKYDTNKYLGNVLPDFTGGMSNNFSYKNFNFGFDLDFQKGGKIFSVTRMFNNYSGLGIETIGNNALGNRERDPVDGTGNSTYTTSAGATSTSGGILIEGVDETTGAPASYYVEASTYWGRLFALHERWLYDASYIKLRTVRVDYDFSKKALKNTPFSAINIGLFANNLWLIHSAIKGLDTSEIEDPIGWTEGGQSPNTRSLGLNVRLTF